MVGFRLTKCAVGINRHRSSIELSLGLSVCHPYSLIVDQSSSGILIGSGGGLKENRPGKMS